MPTTETLEEFYKNKFNWIPDDLQKGIGHFNVFTRESCLAPGSTPVVYSRRDFYKISLTRDRNIYHYAGKSLETEGPTLLFFNPRVPYTFEAGPPADQTGFFCIFTESFIPEKNFADLPMFTPGGAPSYPLNKEQDEEISALFRKMLREIDSGYVYRYDMLRNYVTEIVHYVLKMQPAEILYRHPDANSRITAVFTELLERQFPIESPSQQFNLRSASDYAKNLSVHVNHLNRAVKQVTGKTTTEHIADRMLSEAKALLKFTDWNVSMISYCLGFEEPAHFSHFFRKQTNLTPTAFRIV
ncbi:MAG TPA: AraC family transcriptional regulator [Puia sp.]|jgi:AraC-like DNA-binding protein|nr:AraC family transcriptional regulator [Puia sp.]